MPLTLASEFPSNWLSKNGPGAIPSNVDENDPGTYVDAPPTTKGPVALGKPAECSTQFAELENSCQVGLYCTNLFFFKLISKLDTKKYKFEYMLQIYCCTTEIHQLENPQNEPPVEKKVICKSKLTISELKKKKSESNAIMYYSSGAFGAAAKHTRRKAKAEQRFTKRH